MFKQATGTMILIVSICFLLLCSFIMLFYCTVCLSLIYTINYFCVFPVLRKYRLHKNTYLCKFSIVPEEGWFGQPKYSTPSKKSSYVVSVFAFVFFIKIHHCYSGVLIQEVILHILNKRKRLQYTFIVVFV